MENYEDILCIFGLPRNYSTQKCRLRDPHVFAEARAQLLAGFSQGVVALDIGYCNRPAFSNAWRNVTGLRPGAWQKMHGVRVRRAEGGRCLKPRKTWSKAELRRPRKKPHYRKWRRRKGEDVI